MKAIHHPAPRTAVGTDGSTLAATVDGRRAHGVSYGDVVSYRDHDYYVVRTTERDDGLTRVTAVGADTWNAMGNAEYKAATAELAATNGKVTT